MELFVNENTRKFLLSTGIYTEDQIKLLPKNYLELHPSETSKIKIDFIKEMFPEVLKPNFKPHRNPDVIEKVKLSMFEAGHYQIRKNNPNIDAAIINLVMRAQGIPRTTRAHAKGK